MTSFQIKLIAALTMLIDHIGAALYPDLDILRIIGRVSFPLFAWLIGQGERHTRKFNRYLLRLILAGIVSQPIFSALFPSAGLNIFATLTLGLIAIRLGKLVAQKMPVLPAFKLIFQGLIWIAIALLAEFLETDYGAYGVLTIALLSYVDTQQKDNFVWYMAWACLSVLLGRVYAIASIGFLALWNGQPGRKTKWFYPFYPVHLLILLLIKTRLM